MNEDGEVFRVGDVILFLLNRWREVSESGAFFSLSCFGIVGFILIIDKFKKDDDAKTGRISSWECFLPMFTTLEGSFLLYNFFNSKTGLIVHGCFFGSAKKIYNPKTLDRVAT